MCTTDLTPVLCLSAPFPIVPHPRPPTGLVVAERNADAFALLGRNMRGAVGMKRAKRDAMVEAATAGDLLLAELIYADIIARHKKCCSAGGGKGLLGSETSAGGHAKGTATCTHNSGESVGKTRCRVTRDACDTVSITRFLLSVVVRSVSGIRRAATCLAFAAFVAML